MLVAMSKSTLPIALTLIGAVTVSVTNVIGLLVSIHSHWVWLPTGLAVVAFLTTFFGGFLVGRWGPNQALEMAEAFRSTPIEHWTDPDGLPAVDIGAWWEIEPEEAGV
jgi:hypothetical protein